MRKIMTACRVITSRHHQLCNTPQTFVGSKIKRAHSQTGHTERYTNTNSRQTEYITSCEKDQSFISSLKARNLAHRKGQILFINHLMRQALLEMSKFFNACRNLFGAIANFARHFSNIPTGMFSNISAGSQRKHKQGDSVKCRLTDNR